MSRVIETLYQKDAAFAEMAHLLFGEGLEIYKASPDGADLAAGEKKRQKRQAQVGLGSNVLGITAGAVGLSAAAKDERLKGGGKISRGIYRAGKGAENLARKTKAGKGYYRKISKPGVAAGMAAGAVGLQAANLGGDFVANRVLSREAKKKVKKDLNIPASKGQLMRLSADEAKKAKPHIRAAGKKVTGKKDPVVKQHFDVTWKGEISKVDEDKRQVFGWASIVEMNGKPIVDLQGDYISIDEIEKSAYDYVMKSRKGGDMHKRAGEDPHQASDMIESFLVTADKIEKMGLPEDTPKGWWVGYQVNDPETWNLVKEGKRTGFSIHGRGNRLSKVLDN